MSSIAIVTPSYRRDLARCELLAESVARFASPECRHIVLVPHHDLACFQDRVGRHGAAVVAQEEVLPSWLFALPFSEKWQVSHRGWPVRGWMRQQVVKVAYGNLSTADSVLFVDSDICFVKPFDASLVLRADGKVRLLSEPGVGNEPTHHDWYRRGCRLLGLPERDYCGNGYIGPLLPWSPDHVRGMVRRVEATTGRDWRSVLLHQKSISEYVLYGLYVEEVLGLPASRHFIRDGYRPAHEYWTFDELSDERLLEFVGRMTPDKLALLVQSKADYSFDVYARAVRGLWEGAHR